MPHISDIWEWWFPSALSATSLMIAFCAFYHTVRCSKKNAKWEEEKETVYEPMMEKLRRLDRKVKLCRRMETASSHEYEVTSFLYELSEMLNDLELTCAKAADNSSTD